MSLQPYVSPAPQRAINPSRTRRRRSTRKVARPDDGKMVKRTFHLPSKLDRQLGIHAFGMGRTKSQVLADLIESGCRTYSLSETIDPAKSITSADSSVGVTEETSAREWGSVEPE